MTTHDYSGIIIHIMISILLKKKECAHQDCAHHEGVEEDGGDEEDTELLEHQLVGEQ